MTANRFAELARRQGELRYRKPLERDAERLASQLSRECQIVLLGSIATAKYRDVLVEILGDRVFFPRDFIGRGDMSRGGLMLRCLEALWSSRLFGSLHCLSSCGWCGNFGGGSGFARRTLGRCGGRNWCPLVGTTAFLGTRMDRGVASR